MWEAHKLRQNLPPLALPPMRKLGSSISSRARKGNGNPEKPVSVREQRTSAAALGCMATNSPAEQHIWYLQTS